MSASRPPPSPARRRAQLARLEAELRAARLRREQLELCSGPPGEVEIELARADARIAELLADREELVGAPAAGASSVAAPAVAPANDAPEPLAATPECVSTAEAARMLGVSTDTLERLRTRPDGPPFRRIARRVVYPVDALREYGRRGR